MNNKIENYDTFISTVMWQGRPGMAWVINKDISYNLMLEILPPKNNHLN